MKSYDQKEGNKYLNERIEKINGVLVLNIPHENEKVDEIIQTNQPEIKPNRHIVEPIIQHHSVYTNRSRKNNLLGKRRIRTESVSSVKLK